jgi:hypothetical protein
MSDLLNARGEESEGRRYLVFRVTPQTTFSVCEDALTAAQATNSTEPDGRKLTCLWLTVDALRMDVLRPLEEALADDDEPWPRTA